MAQTTFIEIISDYAMLEIADTRLQKELAESPARFFRKMSFYMLNAIPRFNRPPEARDWLSFTAPVYDGFDIAVPGGYDPAEDYTVETGKVGFEMISAVTIQPDGYGAYEFVPVPIKAYDAETGNVTFAAGVVKAGEELAIDFYTDGLFDRELCLAMKRILGLLVQIVWENRFINDFLLQQPKIKDRSFDVGNEANHMRASTERLRFLNDQVNQELKSFEQNVWYNTVVINHESEPRMDIGPTVSTRTADENP